MVKEKFHGEMEDCSENKETPQKIKGENLDIKGVSDKFQGRVDYQMKIQL